MSDRRGSNHGFDQPNPKPSADRGAVHPADARLESAPTDTCGAVHAEPEKTRLSWLAVLKPAFTNPEVVSLHFYTASGTHCASVTRDQYLDAVAALGAGETPHPPTLTDGEYAIIASAVRAIQHQWERTSGLAHPVAIQTRELVEKIEKLRGVAAPPAVPAPQLADLTLRERIQSYLGNGGFWNPDMMDHDKVRDLILDLRTELDRLSAALPAPPDVQALIGQWRLRAMVAGQFSVEGRSCEHFVAANEAERINQCVDELEAALAASSGSRDNSVDE